MKKGRKVEDITGIRFGKLTVISLEGARQKNGATRWLCKCDCGNLTVVIKGGLKSGSTVSCGCHRLNFLKTSGITHGLRKVPEYSTWVEIKRRCTDPGRPSYKYYGAKGVKMCERWSSFELFYADMGSKPSPDHSIDRYPNKKGDYEPGNCRWATTREQNRNKTSNVYITHNGVTMIMADWARHIGIILPSLHQLLKRKTIQEIIDKYKKW